MSHPRNPITDIIAEARPALASLRFFTATTRGFRDKEQAKLAAFLKEICALDGYSTEEVMGWLKTKAGFVDTSDYRRGDVSQYLQLLQRIPSHLLVRTRDYAALIAGGSGRRPLSDQLRERIASEFSENPVAVPPPVDDEAVELGVRISTNGVERL
jgi:hypothetical protein